MSRIFTDIFEDYEIISEIQLKDFIKRNFVAS